ncbi:MAG: hypothetical protein J6M02_02075 [Clostridia bacterium]|nr:hypothetical protein [Clostridia bacterium]
MKRFIFVLLFMLMINSFTGASFAFYESLPEDIGSNSEILDILNPEEEETINYAETYLISCMAEPYTEITLYERFEDSLFVPMMVDGEAITGIVGPSGMFLADVTFEPNSTNEIMIFAENGENYQSGFRTIIVKEKEKTTRRHRILNIQSFVSEMYKDK